MGHTIHELEIFLDEASNIGSTNLDHY